MHFLLEPSVRLRHCDNILCTLVENVLARWSFVRSNEKCHFFYKEPVSYLDNAEIKSACN